MQLNKKLLSTKKNSGVQKNLFADLDNSVEIVIPDRIPPIINKIVPIKQFKGKIVSVITTKQLKAKRTKVEIASTKGQALGARQFLRRVKGKIENSNGWSMFWIRLDFK